MNHINVTINGRQYRMGCEEGQEVQLLKLAESLESRSVTLRGKFGEIGDARLDRDGGATIMRRMLDAAQRIRGLEQELEIVAATSARWQRERARATQSAGRQCAELRGRPHREDHAGAQPTIGGRWRLLTMAGVNAGDWSHRG